MLHDGSSVSCGLSIQPMGNALDSVQPPSKRLSAHIYIIDAILDAILNVKEIISNWGYWTLIDVNEIISGLSRCCRPPAKWGGPPSHCVNEDHWQTCWVPQLDYRTKRLKKDYGTAHSHEIINTIAGPMRSGAWTKDATFFQHDGSSARGR